MQGFNRTSKPLFTCLLIYLSTQQNRSIILNAFMQNKPNFKNEQIFANPYIARRYKNLASQGHAKTNPIQSQFKANSSLSATPQTQNKPPFGMPYGTIQTQFRTSLFVLRPSNLPKTNPFSCGPSITRSTTSRWHT